MIRQTLRHLNIFISWAVYRVSLAYHRVQFLIRFLLRYAGLCFRYPLYVHENPHQQTLLRIRAAIEEYSRLTNYSSTTYRLWKSSCGGDEDFFARHILLW